MLHRDILLQNSAEVRLWCHRLEEHELFFSLNSSQGYKKKSFDISDILPESSFSRPECNAATRPCGFCVGVAYPTQAANWV